MNSYLYSQLIFNRGSKHIQCTKDSLFNSVGKIGQITCRKMKLDHLLQHIEEEQIQNGSKT